MTNLFRFLPTLRGAAAAVALSWAAVAGAETVAIGATGSTGVAGGDAFAELVYDFDGPYPLLSLDLKVSWDSAVLSWDAANTTVSYDGNTTPIDTLVAALNPGFGSVMLTPAADSFAISLIANVAPPLQGKVTLHIAFDIDGAAAAGVTVVQISGEVASDNADFGEPYQTAARIGIRGGDPLPLPGSGALIGAAALAALAVARRKRPSGSRDAVPAVLAA